MLRITSFVALLFGLTSGFNLDSLEHGKGHKYLKYEEVFTFYSDLARKFPKWVKIYAASELYPKADEWHGITII